MYSSTSPGEWCIGAYVQTGEAALTPEPVIALMQAVNRKPMVSLAGAASYDVYGCNDP